MFIFLSFIISLLIQNPALAAEPPQWPYHEFHVRNAVIAEYLQNMTYQRFEEISGVLKSPKDQDAFKQLYVDLKGKVVRAYPLFDSLIIDTDKEKHVIRVTHTKPLEITVDNRSHFKIDSSNIGRSLKQKSRNATGLSWIIPEAQAVFFRAPEESENKWAFLYAAVDKKIDDGEEMRVHNTYQNKPLRNDDPGWILGQQFLLNYRDDERKALAADVERVIDFLGMKEMTCGYDPKNVTVHAIKDDDKTAKGAYAISFTTKNGDEVIAACGGPRGPGRDGCVFRPAKNGKILDWKAELTTASEPILRWAAVYLNKQISSDKPIRPEDLVLACAREGEHNSYFQSDKSQTPVASEDECYAVFAPGKGSDYKPETAQVLKSQNLLKVPNSKAVGLPKQLKDYMDKENAIWDGGSSKINREIMRGAMSSLEQCCQTRECRDKAWSKAKFKMNEKPASPVVK